MGCALPPKQSSNQLEREGPVSQSHPKKGLDMLQLSKESSEKDQRKTITTCQSDSMMINKTGSLTEASLTPPIKKEQNFDDLNKVQKDDGQAQFMDRDRAGQSNSDSQNSPYFKHWQSEDSPYQPNLQSNLDQIPECNMNLESDSGILGFPPQGDSIISFQNHPSRVLKLPSGPVIYEENEDSQVDRRQKMVNIEFAKRKFNSKSVD